MTEYPNSEIITKDKPHWQTESLGYKGVDLTLNGVTHTKATFEAHEEAFRENIKASDAVLLELSPRAEGLIDEKGDFSPETIGAFLKIYKISPDELKRLLELTREDFGFFAGLERIAAEQGKDIIIMDPYSADPNAEGARLQLRNAEFQLAIRGVLLTGVAAIGAASGGSIFAHDMLKRRHGRRSAIAGISAVLASGITGITVARNRAENSRRETTSSISQNNPFTLALSDLSDYRNAAIASTFTSLADDGRLDHRIAGFYGDAHRAQIRYYLEHPTQRDLKLSTIYQPMIKASPPTYKRFNYQNGSWVRTEDQIIKK